MMVHYLTDPAVASHRLLDTEWSVTRLLSEVARSTDPPFHALIDGGALVTGMTNLEVARWVNLGNYFVRYGNSLLDKWGTHEEESRTPKV